MLPNKSPVYSVLASSNKSGEYIFYAKNIDNLPKDSAFVIQNGNSYIVKTDFENAQKVKAKLCGIIGEAVSFSGSTLDAIFFMNKIGMELKIEESINDIHIFYGYIKGLEKYMFVGNEKINTEIAVSQNKITIGYPIIIGDY